MSEMSGKSLKVVLAVSRALTRASFSILTVGLTYLTSAVIGLTMVQTGDPFALAYRDGIVTRAQASPILVALARNDRWQAALLDFAANLFGACANTLGGLGVVAPYPLIAYRGWIGGIVSINSSHVSRLADPSEAAYYLSTLVLQLIPYTLAGGAGVNMGVAFVRPNAYYQGDKWWGIPTEAVRDVLRIVTVQVLF